MSTYYQVCVSFSLFHGKHSLKSISLHTTSEYFPFMVPSRLTGLSLSRFFLILLQAEEYISFILSRYPNSGIPRPVLDSSQLSLC
ncbi:MAG: hypothetical protein LBC76_03085 [Treponema sp.]|nr:hypothetical protein [Treponema sp.]